MLAKRLRTLSIFAGGCLSGAVVIIVWHTDTAPTRAERATAVISAPGEAPSDAEPLPVARRIHAKNVHAGDEGAEPSPVKHALPTKNGDEAAEAPTAESGQAVSEVLAHLEAAYREQQAAAPTNGTAGPASSGTPAPTTTEPPAAVAPASAVVATAPALGAPSRAEAPVAVAALAPAPVTVQAVAFPGPAVAAPLVAAPPVAAPTAAAPVARAPVPAAPVAGAAPAAVPAAAPPAAVSPLAAAPAAPTTNVSIGSVHQGDTYHVQQVAVMQYVPMFAPWPYSGYGYAQPHAGYGYAQPHAPHSQPKRVPYPTTLTNPDNPWGFDFPPPLEMVK